MTLDYFYGQSGELFAYFRIPKALFQDSRFRQLSTDARTLYGILLDRMSLSAKNGWLDEQGRVYIIYTVREVQESVQTQILRRKLRIYVFVFHTPQEHHGGQKHEWTASFLLLSADIHKCQISL